MSEDVLFELLKDVEFCDMNSGVYYRMSSVISEDGKPLVIIEPA